MFLGFGQGNSRLDVVTKQEVSGSFAALQWSAVSVFLSCTVVGMTLMEVRNRV